MAETRGEVRQVEVRGVRKGSPKARRVSLFILPHEIKWQHI